MSGEIEILKVDRVKGVAEELKVLVSGIEKTFIRSRGEIIEKSSIGHSQIINEEAHRLAPAIRKQLRRKVEAIFGESRPTVSSKISQEIQGKLI